MDGRATQQPGASNYLCDPQKHCISPAPPFQRQSGAGERESFSSLTSRDCLETQWGNETGFRCFTSLMNRFDFSVEDQLTSWKGGIEICWEKYTNLQRRNPQKKFAEICWKWECGDTVFFKSRQCEDTHTHLWEGSSCHRLPPASLHLWDFRTSPLVGEVAQWVKHLRLDPQNQHVHNPIRGSWILRAWWLLVSPGSMRGPVSN